MAQTWPTSLDPAEQRHYFSSWTGLFNTDANERITNTTWERSSQAILDGHDQLDTWNTNTINYIKLTLGSAGTNYPWLLTIDTIDDSGNEQTRQRTCIVEVRTKAAQTLERTHDPQEKLIYQFSWADMLNKVGNTGEVLTASNWTQSSQAALDGHNQLADTRSDIATASQWTGGAINNDYDWPNIVDTLDNAGRTQKLKQAFKVQVREL